MPMPALKRPLKHFRRSDTFHAVSVRAFGDAPLDRSWLEPHPEALAVFDEWLAARDRYTDMETKAGAITRQIAQAAEDYRLNRKAALMAGSDPESVVDEGPALEAQHAAILADMKLMRGGIEELGTRLAQAIHAAAPAIVEAAQEADAAALDKVAKAATAANNADDAHRDAAAVVALLTGVQIKGGMIGNANRMRSKVPSVAITVGAIDDAREYAASLVSERDEVLDWQAAQA